MSMNKEYNKSRVERRPANKLTSRDSLFDQKCKLLLSLKTLKKIIYNTPSQNSKLFGALGWR